VYTYYPKWRSILFSASFLFAGINPGIASPKCTLIVSPTIHFSEQDSERDIPDNEGALFCALTVAKIPPFVGGGGMTGGCIVRRNPTTHHWTFQSAPPGVPGTECEVTCIKAIECKDGD
jgi:hypothetical protein